MFIPINAPIKKTSQINNLTVHLKELSEKEEMKCKVSRRKDIINTREKVNELETKKKKEKKKSVKLRAGFF